MKKKAIIFVILSIVLLMTLSGCGGGSDKDNDSSADSNVEDSSDSDSDSDENGNSGNDFDLNSTDEQPISKARADKAVLENVLNNWYPTLSSEEIADLEYEDIVEQVGVPASFFQIVGDFHMYVWLSAESDSSKLALSLREDYSGAWESVGLNGNNLGAAL